MTSTSGLPIEWKGRESVESIVAILRSDGFARIILPENFHHALCAQFHTNTLSSQVEALDIHGGAELLVRVGGLKLLESIGNLVEPVRSLDCSVRIVSPNPTIIIMLPGKQKEIPE